ncbi:MAG: class I SAM-dependent methyltransferase [Planctomycetota bacterium]
MTAAPSPTIPLCDIPALPVEQLDEMLRTGRFDAAGLRTDTPWDAWSMQRDDAPIFAAIVRALVPKRHLEFGTWEGFGSRLVLQNSPATVWSLNLPHGETTDTGDWQYAGVFDDPAELPPAAGPPQDFREGGGHVYYQTDAHGFIGRLVHDARLGHRFNQVLCDSRDWDTAAYPSGFFDSVFIDGGHHPDTVISDTRKALPLLRPGGVILWHDACPDPDILAQGGAPAGVMTALRELSGELQVACSHLCWIDRSQLVIGIGNDTEAAA